MVELQAPAGVVPQHFRLVRLVPFPAGGRGGTMKRDGGAAVPGQSREGKCPRGAPDQVLAPHQVLAPQCRAVGREQGRRGRWRAWPGGGGAKTGWGLRVRACLSACPPVSPFLHSLVFFCTSCWHLLSAAWVLGTVLGSGKTAKSKILVFISSCGAGFLSLRTTDSSGWVVLCREELSRAL